MEGLKNIYTRIKGISERRRLPRLGKIRLGIKQVNRQGISYPVETSHFVVPAEVARVYTDKPIELDIMLPLDDPEAVFPQRLVWFGMSKGPKCMGDGEMARRLQEDGTWKDRECPCELLDQKKCSKRAYLLALLPTVSLAGVYQIDISSYHSIVDLNSGMDYVRALTGRLAMVPLKLCRVPRETHGSGRKEIHYPLQLRLNTDITLLNAIRADRSILAPLRIPEASVENPELDDPSKDEQTQREFDCPDIMAPVTQDVCERCQNREGCPALT